MASSFQTCDPRRLALLMDLDAGAAVAANPEGGSSPTSPRVNDSGTPARRLEAASPGAGAPRIPGYEVTGRLGQGGMGVVWRAIQVRTRRAVALKVLPPWAPGTPRARRRFEREVELAARLEHPGIARVYDSGTAAAAAAGGRDGRVDYYAMELVEGVHLDRYVRARELGPRDILALMRDVCLAVQYAHQRGVIHRDLKPSNVLVTPDGRPHVVDFGLAKAIQADGEGDVDGVARTRVTRPGQATGTLAFMPPEQAAGAVDAADTRSDVFALGATLYLLLTGRPPHDLAGPEYEVIARVAREEVRPPRALDPDLPAELEWLLLKALAHDPERRYASAGALADDIGRFLAGEALAASPPSRAYRARKFVRKHRTGIAAAAAVIVLLVGATAFSTWQAVRAPRAGADAIRQHAIAKLEADKQAAINRFLNDMLTSATRESRSVDDPARGPDVTLDEMVGRAARSLDAGALAGRPELEAAVRKTIGIVYLRLLRPQLAEHHFRRALDLDTQLYGSDHPDVADCMVGLGYAIALNNDAPPEAERLMRAGLELQRKQYGHDGLEVVDTLWELGFVLYRQWQASGDPRKLAEDEQLCRRAVAIREKLPPQAIPPLSTPLAQLGQALAARHKLPEAEQVFRRAIAAQTAVGGPDHALVARHLRALIDVLVHEGKLTDAEGACREALRIGPHNADDMGRLIDILRGQSKSEELARLIPSMVGAVKEDPAPGWGVVRFANRIRDQGYLADAEALYRRVLELSPRRVTPSQAPQVYVGLTRALLAQGKVAEARAAAEESLPAFKAAVAQEGKRGPTAHFAGTVTQYAEQLKLAGRLPDAEAQFRRARDVTRQLRPEVAAPERPAGGPEPTGAPGR